MNSSLFCALPLPLSQPLLFSRLAALGVLHCDPQGQLVERVLHLSRSTPHTILSPAYLFKQNIDPNNLVHGMTGLKFYQACCKSLTPQNSNDVLVTFSMRHLMVLNSLALQNLQLPAALRTFNRAVDLKTALATCHYFGEHQIPLVRSLDKIAAFMQFPGKMDNQLQRLDAMLFIYSKLMQTEPKIMLFMLRSKQEMVDSILKSSHPYFIHINEQGQLCMLKLLAMSPDHVYIKALCATGGKVELQAINLDLMPLIAPLSILTPERQERLKFNVNEYIKRLENLDLNDLISDNDSAQAVNTKQRAYHSKSPAVHLAESADAVSNLLEWNNLDRNFYDRILFQLPSQRLKMLQRPLGTPLTQAEFEASFKADKDWRRLTVYYQYENFPELRNAELEALYRKIVNEHMRARAPLIVQECALLRNNIASFNQPQLEFLNRLFNYFLM